jgi:predicted dienelactone hydrolase
MASDRPGRFGEPVDVSFALGHLRASTTVGARADQCHIAALGHSCGGVTALQLGGAIYDPAAVQRYSASHAARRGRGQ